jgi:outer membrane protein OmpA-like peptidoglycan-associated protein
MRAVPATILVLGLGLGGMARGVAQPASPPCIGSLSTEQILGCLAAPKKTRGFPRTRGVGVEGEQAPADTSVNLMVNFDFNSAELTNDGMIALQALGRALADPSLSGAKFLIAGHTDAVGSDAYNQTLSENRARAVVTYLVTQFQLDPSRFQATGYGKTQPYDANDTSAAINRRVQVTRLSPPQ